MARVAWLHCFAGVTGEMVLGALLDAGAPLDEVLAVTRRLPVDGWTVAAEPVSRAGLGATMVTVRCPSDATVVRTYAHLQGLIAEARLPRRIRERTEGALAVLAEAAAALHRRPPAQVHLHDVGGLGALVVSLATAAALETLAVDDVVVSAVAQGSGTASRDHGLAPVPAPVVMGMLTTRNAPVFGREVSADLTSATRAAIVVALAGEFGPMPSLRAAAVGYGAGAYDLDGIPYVTQVVVGEPHAADLGTQPLALLEANVDDITGEVLAHTVGALLDAGAIEAWCTPVVTRRGRPGHRISAVCDHALVEQIGQVLLVETGSSRVHVLAMGERTLSRHEDRVDVDGHPVRITVGPGRAKASFEDAARAAAATRTPVREVILRAEAAWRDAQRRRSVESSPSDGDPDPPSPA